MNYNYCLLCTEQPLPLSSSSISTNTTSSEVTSLASFEQEDKALDSCSDYEENWECDQWGDIRGDIQVHIRTWCSIRRVFVIYCPSFYRLLD